MNRMIAETHHKTEAVSASPAWSEAAHGGLQAAPEARFSETETEYFLLLPAPGRERQHFDVTISGNQLIIGMKRAEYNQQPPHPFREHSDSEQKINLPPDADSMMTQAIYRGGELCIRIPRRQQAEQKIQVKVYVY